MNDTIGREAPEAQGLPAIGSLLPFMQAPLPFLEGLWRRHGDTFRFRVGPKRFLAVVHPDANEHVLLRNRENYVKGAVYDQLRVLIGQGLITLEGDAWKRHRRLANPAFHREQIRRFVDVMVAVTGQTLDAWRQRWPTGSTFDAHDAFMHLTLEIVAATLFGQSVATSSSSSGQAFAEALEFLSRRGNMPIVLPLWVPTPGNRKLKRNTTELDATMYAIIEKGRRNKDGAPTLLRFLLDAVDDETGTGLTDLEIRNEVMGMVFAGHETTALTLTWAFVLLRKRPEIIAALRAEIEQVLGDRPPTADDIPRLPYVRRVLDEVLRLRSPVWCLARDVVKDDVIPGGFRAHAGEAILPLPFITHRHPTYWGQDPDRFDPEHFLPERVKARPNGAYLPFSLGARMCIGNIFSLTEGAIILVMMLQRGHFQAVRDIEPKPLMTLRPKTTVPVTVRWS